MLVEAEKRTGIHIAPRLVFEFPTIRRLAVEARHPEARAHSPIVTVQTGGSSAPFFFLHGDYVEGGLYCVKIARHLGQDRPFYAIDPHGVHDAPLDTVEEMAASRLELVRKLRPRGPYVLGGYCNGALVAFEMARQLQAAGETVSSLILISVEPPNAEFAWLDRLIGRRASDGNEKLGALPRWRAAWRRYLAALAAPVPVTQKPRRFARKAVRLVRKVFGLMRPYRGPAHLLWPGELPRRDSTAGWGSVIPQIELIEVPGGHFTALQGENLLVLCENLRSCLREDQA
jgi:thioesterase domain-containing protein